MMVSSTEYTEIPTLDDSVYPDKNRAELKKRGSSCSSPLKRILYVVLIVLGVLVSLTLVASVCGYVYISKKVQKITTTEPRHFPVVEYPEEELRIVGDRAKLFFDTLVAGQVPNHDLSVTADEVNGLLGHSDYLRGNAFVAMEENKLTIDMSLPAFPLPGGSGRYFVATEHAVVSEDHSTWALDVEAPIDPFDGGKLLTAILHFSTDPNAKHHRHVMNILQGKFLDWTVCPKFVEKKENLLEHLYEEDDHAAAVLDGLEDISIENGKIVFKAARPHDDGSSPLNKQDEDENYAVSETTKKAKVLSPLNLLRRLM